jgi:hypothetical protein
MSVPSEKDDLIGLDSLRRYTCSAASAAAISASISSG